MNRHGTVPSLHRSYHHTPFSTPYTYNTLPEVFDSTANRVPARTAAVVYQSRENRESLTFAELQTQSKALATSLAKRGYTRGDRVAFFAPNCMEYFTVQLALVRLGCNAFLFGEVNSLDEDIRKYKCCALIMYVKTEQEADICRTIMSRSCENRYIDVITVGPKCNVMAEGAAALGSVMKASGGKRKVDGVTGKSSATFLCPDDPMFVFFTSGSTGEPKAVQYSHTKYLHQCPSLEMLGLTEESCFFNDRPMTWVDGNMTFLAMAVYGTTGVMIDSALLAGDQDLEFGFEVLQREKCTDIHMMQYHMVDFVNRYDPLVYPLPFLKHIITGGQKINLEILNKLVELLTAVEYVVDAYGSIEVGIMAGARCSRIYVEQDGLEIYEGTEVKIIDENHCDVPRGTRGEVCVRSPTVFSKCYVDDGAASMASVDASGWFQTGDIGMMKENGRMTICGRKDDMIKQAVVKIFPAEIETILKKHPVVSDVVVIGVPDVRLGEVICACVLTDDELALFDVKKWSEDKFPTSLHGVSLAPAYYVPFSEFPKKNTGKTDRKLVKQWALEKLSEKSHLLDQKKDEQ